MPILSIAVLGALLMADLDVSSSPMRPYIEAFSSDEADLMRYYPGRLAPERGPRFKRFYGEWTERLRGIDFDAMPQDGKVDYVVFRNYLEHELKRLDFLARSNEETAPYLPFAKTILDLEAARKKTVPMNPQQAAAQLTSLAAELESLLKGSPGRHAALGARAALQATSLRNLLRQWHAFYTGYDPLFTWWADGPYAKADAALEKYTVFLREKVGGLRPGSDEITGDPIGRDALMSELAFEMIPYTPEELIEIANREFAWCEGEMKRASREMGYGDDWKKALEKVKTMYVEPGKQPELIREMAREAEKFLDDHDLVTVPEVAHETWSMQMMSPERQLVNPFFTGGETISVSYPTASMTHEQKMMSMRGNNIPFARATVFHELIPGHELQGYMASRYRPYRSSVGGTPFVTEGWALYWELLLYDMKFQKTPEDRVGALFWRMHRCARIVFSLSFHLGKMTPQECVDFLVERVGHERENAVGEVRRSVGRDYSPLYQAAYLLGGMQLYSLRQELVGAGKITNRQFHDAVLKENRIPIEMLRAALTGRKLTRNYQTGWRFYSPRQ